MNGFNRKRKRNRKVLLISIAIFVLMCAVISAVCVQFYAEVRSTVKNESKDYMMEISKQMSNNISRSITDNFSALQTVAVSLENQIYTFDELHEKVEELRAFWNFDKILVVDPNARAWDENKDEIKLFNDQYLQDVIVSRQTAMSASEMVDGIESVVFAVPVKFTIQLGGEQNKQESIVAIAATYELETFDRILAMSAFEGQGYAHIVRNDGSVVFHSNSDTSFETGYNLLNTIEKATGSKKGEFERVRTAIRNGAVGFEEFVINDTALYMTYLPLQSAVNSTEDPMMDDMAQQGTWRLITFVPVSVVNVKSTMLLNFTLLLSGFICVLFIALSAIILGVNLKHRRKMEYIAYYDEVTGGNTVQYFYEVVNKELLHAGENEYALIYINLEKFKLLNEQMGREKCNALLHRLNQSIFDDLTDKECIGRLYADNFCVLIEFEDQRILLDRIKRWKDNFYQTQDEISAISFVIEFGINIIEDPKVSLDLVIDRAKLSLSETSPIVINNIRLSIYNEDMRRRLVREKYLEDMMERSMDEGEFQVYLQPKYDTRTERIGGAEALVRWSSTKEGLIFPGEFIPLFEKNGFIKKLDMYIFETVCQLLQEWLRKGYDPPKVSVNCSKEHLKDENFLGAYIEIADRYNVPRKYLEIEFTESIVFEDIKYFSEIIDAIHEAGFGCSMDDFGSGYSSLSMIQDIPVDTIKLDRIFFYNRAIDSSERTESVVASIINMSKLLKITTVAEGVEAEDQVRMLQRLGCDLIQGYYFAKPMPSDEFERLAFGANIEDDQSPVPTKTESSKAQLVQKAAGAATQKAKPAKKLTGAGKIPSKSKATHTKTDAKKEEKGKQDALTSGKQEEQV